MYLLNYLMNTVGCTPKVFLPMGYVIKNIWKPPPQGKQWNKVTFCAKWTHVQIKGFSPEVGWGSWGGEAGVRCRENRAECRTQMLLDSLEILDSRSCFSESWWESRATRCELYTGRVCRDCPWARGTCEGPGTLRRGLWSPDSAPCASEVGRPAEPWLQALAHPSVSTLGTRVLRGHSGFIGWLLFSYKIWDGLFIPFLLNL